MFSSAPRRINLINLARQLTLKDVSLRDQCYRSRFYGADGTIENMLMTLEGRTASAVRELVASPSPSPSTLKSVARYNLLAFVASQMLRTTAMAQKVEQSFDTLIKTMYRDDSRFRDVDFTTFKMRLRDPVIISLTFLSDVLESIQDLKVHLVLAQEGQNFRVFADHSGSIFALRVNG